MQHLKYAFRFISACAKQALKHPRLLKPVSHLWMGGFGLVILWLIPMLIVVVLIGVQPLGLVLIGLCISLLLFSLLAWSAITALETCRIFDNLTWKDQDLPGLSQQKRDYAHWQDVLFWVLLRPGFALTRLFTQAFSPKYIEKTEWLSEAYLMLPVIALEDFNLREAIDRIKQLLRDRLPRFQPGLVSVRQSVGIIQWVLIVGGALLGTQVGLKLADFQTAGLLSRLLAIVMGTLIAGCLTLLGLSFSSFNCACYHTTLYQWALNVENARMTGNGSQSVPPKILTQVMKTKSPHQKES